MIQHVEKAEPHLEAPSTIQTSRWLISVDEIADSKNWLLEIDSPRVYLTFELADLSVLERAIALLNSTLDRQNALGTHSFVPETDDVALGSVSWATVHLLRDNEDFPRCFLVVDSGSRSTLRITLDEDSIRAFAEALVRATRDFLGETDIPTKPAGSFTFVGGPLDQVKFDHTEINAVSSVVPVFTESGNRQFLLMPSPEVCDLILRGEASKDGPHDTLHPYERVFLPGGVEYHHAVGGQFDAARRESSRALSTEEQALEQSFGEYADRFIEQLSTTELTGSTEVSILYRCVDRQGREVPPIRESVTPTTRVRFPGDKEWRREFAARAHLDSIIGNINSLVRNAPTGFVSFPKYTNGPVQIRGFDLEIERPEE